MPPPSPEALAHSDRLRDFIAAEIHEAGGWLPFERYMDLALYAPGLGYYAAGAAKFGGPGDFVTAPEITPLFARTVARPVAHVLAATGGDVLELGAGTGRLAADLLGELGHLGQLPERYLILEVSAALRARQQERLAGLPAELSRRVAWLDALPERLRGAVVANEVLDALPVHLIVWTSDGIQERGVCLQDGRFAWEDRALSPGALLDAARRLPVAPPYLSEISLRAPALVRELGRRLAHGALLFFDYGFPEATYYHPDRMQGTLMCHYRHYAHDDPLLLPGLQDVTAHVDFSAVRRAAELVGLEPLAYAPQARFLLQWGVLELLARTPAENASAYLPLANQVQRLLNPAEMGELFKAAVFGRGLQSLFPPNPALVRGT